MSIIERARFILASNINALLEKASDPLKVLKRTLGEMQEALMEMRALLLELAAEKAYLEEEIKKRKDLREKWQERSRLALEKSREDLAREALVQKESLGLEVRAFEEALAVNSSVEEKLKKECERLRLKIVEVRSTRSMLIARAHSERLVKIAPHIGPGAQGELDRAIAEIEAKRELERLKGEAVAESPDKGAEELPSAS